MMMMRNLRNHLDNCPFQLHHLVPQLEVDIGHPSLLPKIVRSLAFDVQSNYSLVNQILASVNI